MKKLITKETKGVLPIENENLVGKILVLDAKFLSVKYKFAEHQLWKATGGFGCDPNLQGRAIFCTALADGEEYRWDRYKFIGMISEETAKNYISEKDN